MTVLSLHAAIALYLFLRKKLNGSIFLPSQSCENELIDQNMKPCLLIFSDFFPTTKLLSPPLLAPLLFCLVLSPILLLGSSLVARGEEGRSEAIEIFSKIWIALFAAFWTIFVTSRVLVVEGDGENIPFRLLILRVFRGSVRKSPRYRPWLLASKEALLLLTRLFRQMNLFASRRKLNKRRFFPSLLRRRNRNYHAHRTQETIAISFYFLVQFFPAMWTIRKDIHASPVFV